MAGEREARVTARVDLVRRRPPTEDEAMEDENIRIRMQVLVDRAARELERRLNEVLADAEATGV